MKAIFKILFLLGAFLLLMFQKSFLPHFDFQNSTLNLLLVFLFFIAFFEEQNSEKGIIAALVWGIGMDIFSGYFFGIFTILLITTFTLIKLLKNFLETSRAFSFLILYTGALAYYYLIYSFITSYSRGLYFNLPGFLYSFLFGILLYLLKILIYVPVCKKFK